MTLPTGWTRVLDKTRNLVLARTVVDAGEMVATHPSDYAPVTDGALAIPEVLHALGTNALASFARTHGVAAPAGVDTAHLVATLTAMIEAGSIPMPVADAEAA